MLLKSLPFQLIICLGFAMLAGHFLPLEIIRVTYTLSVVFKELLLAFLPFVISQLPLSP
jgi:Na+/H+-dicarboxylate symporter